MWETYPGAQRDLYELGAYGTIAEEGTSFRFGYFEPFSPVLTNVHTVATSRLWTTWLNAASLEFGGRLVEPQPFK